ncbi:MAG: hypothetical protein R2735_04055 [Microthrixaceae bacterium]
MATSVNMAGLAGVLPGWGSYEDCAWGLGPEIRGTKTPHWMGETAPASTWADFGGRGSFLWVDPDAGFGCVVATDRAFDDWAVNAWPRFSDDLRVAVRASFDLESPDLDQSVPAESASSAPPPVDTASSFPTPTGEWSIGLPTPEQPAQASDYRQQ